MQRIKYFWLALAASVLVACGGAGVDDGAGGAVIKKQKTFAWMDKASRLALESFIKIARFV